MQRFHARLWWALLGLTVAGLVAWNAVARSKAGRGAAGRRGPSVSFRLAAQYAVGARSLLAVAGEGRQAQQIVDSLEEQAATAADRLCLVAVLGEVSGAAAARAWIEKVRAEALSPAEREDLRLLARAYAAEGAVAWEETDRDRLISRHGWFGRLALVHRLDAGDPARREVLAPARRTAIVLLVATVVGFLALTAGLVLLVLAVIAWRAGRLTAAYRASPARPRDVVWLETVVLLLAGTLGITILPAFLPAAGGKTYLLVWGLALVPFWPLLRGTPLREWREGLGLVAGRGVLRELGAGVVGYVAGLPIVAAGMLLTVLLSRLLGSEVSHPAVEEVGAGGGRLLLVYLGAALWAPLVEETCFRGAFFRYLRPHTSALAAAVLVSLVFAMVHPQGIAGVPAILSLGVVFALIREWRGSLAGCMFVHAAHNFTLLTLTMLALG